MKGRILQNMKVNNLALYPILDFPQLLFSLLYVLGTHILFVD